MRTNTYRFRMTIEADTPQGAKKVASVYEVWASYKMKFLPDERARDWGLKGEALVIDLPDRPVFALLKAAHSKHDDLVKMSMAALDPAFQNDIVECAGRIQASDSVLRGEVSRIDWPLMVRFRDIDDPKSVETVEPEAIGINRIWLETTNDVVTEGIEKVIPWVNHLDIYRADPTNPFTSTLPDDFGGFRS